MRKIDLIVIHCSATRVDRTLTAFDLETLHRRRGFNGTGYHYYIRKDGTTLLTRILTGQVNYDHLLVVISARRGSISYDSSFEKLPAQLSKYFSNNSLIVLYPDQLGEPQDAVSFSNPRNEAQHYEKVGKWVYKWFKED